MKIKIGQIIEIHTTKFFEPSMGKVMNVSPLQCRLKNGHLFTVNKEEVIPLRKNLQILFSEDFE